MFIIHCSTPETFTNSRKAKLSTNVNLFFTIQYKNVKRWKNLQEIKIVWKNKKDCFCVLDSEINSIPTLTLKF